MQELLGYLDEQEGLSLNIIARLGGYAVAMSEDEEDEGMTREEELAAAMATGFLSGKATAFEACLQTLDADHQAECGCHPCVVARAIRAAMTASPEERHLVINRGMHELDESYPDPLQDLAAPSANNHPYRAATRWRTLPCPNRATSSPSTGSSSEDSVATVHDTTYDRILRLIVRCDVT